MLEATKVSFVSLCRSYERLSEDGKRIIMMHVNPKLLEAVERVRSKGQGDAPAPNKPPGKRKRRSRPDSNEF